MRDFQEVVGSRDRQSQSVLSDKEHVVTVEQKNMFLSADRSKLETMGIVLLYMNFTHIRDSAASCM